MKYAVLLLCLAWSITASQAVKVDGIPGLDVFSNGKTFNMTRIVKGASKLRAKLPSARQVGGSAANPSAACAVGSADLRFLEPIVMSAQVDAVLGSTDPITQQAAAITKECEAPATDCVLQVSTVTATVGSATRDQLTISGDYSAFFGSDVPSPGYKLSLSALNLGTTTVSAVVESNTYPVTPIVTVLDGMLVVYLPPYEPTVTVTDPELVIKFVVLTFPDTPKACCNADNQLKPAGTVCSASASLSCTTDAVCDAVSGDCPANPTLPNNTVCAWRPPAVFFHGSSYGPSYASASSADSSSSTVQPVITSSGATKKIMMKTSGYRSDPKETNYNNYNNNYNNNNYNNKDYNNNYNNYNSNYNNHNNDYDSYGGGYGGGYGSSYTPCQGRCQAGACRLALVGGDKCCTVDKDANNAATFAKEGKQQLYCLKEKDSESA